MAQIDIAFSPVHTVRRFHKLAGYPLPQPYVNSITVMTMIKAALSKTVFDTTARWRNSLLRGVGKSPLSIFLLAAVVVMVLCGPEALAHNVARGDQSFLEQNTGISIFPYMYLGAKHMVTGYDHLFYLSGVIFFLFSIREVATYVSLFALGHSITLLLGVLANLQVNVYLVDAVIGLSVVYKAFENIGGFKALFAKWIDTRAAVLFFGLFHGLGLSTKLQELSISKTGLIVNMVSFNIGVELGQLLALTFLVLLFNVLRSFSHFERHAVTANVVLMTAGFVLIGYQLTGYFVNQT